jgi:hypothetical protein
MALQLIHWDSVMIYRNNGQLTVSLVQKCQRNEVDQLVHNWDRAGTRLKLDRRLIVNHVTR